MENIFLKTRLQYIILCLHSSGLMAEGRLHALAANALAAVAAASEDHDDAGDFVSGVTNAFRRRPNSTRHSRNQTVNGTGVYLLYTFSVFITAGLRCILLHDFLFSVNAICITTREQALHQISFH